MLVTQQEAGTLRSTIPSMVISGNVIGAPCLGPFAVLDLTCELQGLRIDTNLLRIFFREGDKRCAGICHQAYRRSVDGNLRVEVPVLRQQGFSLFQRSPDPSVLPPRKPDSCLQYQRSSLDRLS